jgi:hypothetical protein
MSSWAIDFGRGSKPLQPSARRLALKKSARQRLACAALALASLALAGCDKCGDPVKFNMPSLPKSCYGISETK